MHKKLLRVHEGTKSVERTCGKWTYDIKKGLKDLWFCHMDLIYLSQKKKPWWVF